MKFNILKKNPIGLLLILLSIIFLSFKSADKKVTIWMIGDSTMANKSPRLAPETGWGMVMNEFVNGMATVRDRALNGRSSKSFVDEGHWKAVYDSIQPGDFVIIQFGHNDEKPDVKRHTDPFTTFKQYLKNYVEQTRSKGGKPIICSSIVRRHFDGEGHLIDTHGDYITAAKQVAEETHTPYVNMEGLTRKLVSSLGPERSKKIYDFCKPGEYKTRPKGAHDSTHLNPHGARVVAGLFVKEVKKQHLEIAKYFR